MEIPVFSANLIDRTDRKEHIQLEYRSFPEFKMTIIPAIRENHGAVGLWKTLKLILTERVSDELDFFIFCEDDHIFTEVYSIDFLIKCINDAKKHKADVLLGGISWFDMAVQISDELFWVNSFSGTQFVVFFRKFYKKMRDIDDFQFHDTIDQKIGELSDKKFVIYPFISIQKDFGYSDATIINNVLGRVDRLFKKTSKKIEMLKKIKAFYNSH